MYREWYFIYSRSHLHRYSAKTYSYVGLSSGIQLSNLNKNEMVAM